uniref:Uncharacterized protein n=1 Tax=Amphilophus citrinellus TaxID=61819 RepID=A0A3Q0SVU1_AMPCI
MRLGQGSATRGSRATCGSSRLNLRLCAARGNYHLQQLLFHRVSDQVRPQPSRPAVQIIGGDGIGNLGGIQGLLQPRLQRHQRLSSLSHGSLGVLVQSSGLSLDVRSRVAAGTGLLNRDVFRRLRDLRDLYRRIFLGDSLSYSSAVIVRP